MDLPAEGLLARALDSLTDIFTLVLDQEQRVVYANAAFLEHFGLRWPEVSGRLVGELVTPVKGPGPDLTALGPIEKGPLYPARTLLTRKIQGKKFVYEATLYPLLDDTPGPWTIGIIRDVTDRHDLESQVRQLDELERNLVQASMDGIIVNDMEGNILIFNEGAAKILGYRPEEVIGKLNAGRLYPRRLAHEIKEMVYGPAYGGVGLLENFETVARHKDGTLVPIWLSARLLYEDGREVGIVGYFKDLRERKKMEEDLLRNERLAALGRMVAHITHEIKNPLLVIGGFAQQLEHLPEMPQGARRKLKLIHEEVQCLEKVLADLGSFTRITPTQKIPADLPSLVREVAELMEAGFKETRVVFRFEDPPPMPPFPFDPGQIRQVLINLFKNALEAMPRGGQLTVGLKTRQDQIVLTVTDTGPGIPPEHMSSLFTPFFSTKEKGSGLGLTICRGLVEQHGGKIKIDSEVDQGTTLTIHLPRNSS